MKKMLNFYKFLTTDSVRFRNIDIFEITYYYLDEKSRKTR
jgi:hypothetical protein